MTADEATPSTTQTQPIPTAIELANAIRSFLMAEKYYKWNTSTSETQGHFDPFGIDECEENLVEPLKKLICDKVGHTPIQDQCCKPEHDFCLWCRVLTPGQA